MDFLVEVLLAYALDRDLMDKADAYYVRNQLLDILKLEEPYGETAERGLPCEKAFQEARKLCPDDTLTPEPILSQILDKAYEKGLLEENLTTYRDLLDARLMGAILRRPGEFFEKMASQPADAKADKKAQTDFFYQQEVQSHYIMKERIDKNLEWKSATAYGNIEITINLSKPEKDPREVARLRNVKSTAYPKCLLCAENVGYQGRLNHPARQTLRQLPLTLQGENWFMQYSPYVYYNEHCIVLKEQHVPMCVSEKTWRRLFDFLDVFPHYFLGSNAGLPIVGGSILFHEHYQGGRYHFPMEDARVLKTYADKAYPDVTVEYVLWPLTTIRLRGANREHVACVADKILKAWENYSNPAIGLINKDADGTLHHAITPIARKKGDLYELDLALRSNLTSEALPDGIYHPHPEYWHIKKENIGLIEVMGRAILPGRLQTELGLVEDILTGAKKLDTLCAGEEEALAKHRDWVIALTAEYGTAMKPAEAHQLVQDEVGRIFSKVLECCGVFPQGTEAYLDDFIAKALNV